MLSFNVKSLLFWMMHYFISNYFNMGTFKTRTHLKNAHTHTHTHTHTRTQHQLAGGRAEKWFNHIKRRGRGTNLNSAAYEAGCVSGSASNTGRVWWGHILLNTIQLFFCPPRFYHAGPHLALSNTWTALTAVCCGALQVMLISNIKRK